MPGVMRTCLPRASAAFITVALRALLSGLMIAKSESGSEAPRGAPPSHVTPRELVRSAGTNTLHLPRASTYRKGFSRTTGVVSTVVCGGVGKLFDGAPSVPTNTMFQFDPFQPPSALLRVSHCCWL